jgi:hypothetical protein
MESIKTRSRQWGLFFGGALLGVQSIAVADTRLQLSAGAEYSSGDFGGTTKTTVLLAPITAKVTSGNWSFRASVPYVQISGPANVSVVIDDDGGSNSGSGSSGSSGSSGTSGSSGSGSGGDGSDDSGSGSGSSGSGSGDNSNRTIRGIGDTSLSATYSFNSIADSLLYADVIARVRLPTGDEVKGTGTGATDYGLQGEVGIDAEAGGVYASGGRRFLGATTGLQRIDGWQAGAGAWINFGESAVLGAYYDWRQGSATNVEDPSEVGAYLTLKMSEAWKIEGNIGKALNSDGADYSVGATLIWRAAGYGK